MTDEEMIQKIYEVIKLVDCMQYNPFVDFNYLRAKGAYNIIKNQVEHIEAENAELRATLSKMETVEKELRERLEKAVELPCKVGDKLYEIIEGEVQGERVENYRIDNMGIWVTVQLKFGTSTILLNEARKIFLTREAAEARLKELGGRR